MTFDLAITSQAKVIVFDRTETIGWQLVWHRMIGRAGGGAGVSLGCLDCVGHVFGFLSGRCCFYVLRGVCREWKRLVEKNDRLSTMVALHDYQSVSGPFGNDYRNVRQRLLVMMTNSFNILHRHEIDALEEMSRTGIIPGGSGHSGSVRNFWDLYDKHGKLVIALKSLSYQQNRLLGDALGVWSVLSMPAILICFISSIIALLALQAALIIESACVSPSTEPNLIPTWIMMGFILLGVIPLGQLYFRRWRIHNRIQTHLTLRGEFYDYDDTFEFDKHRDGLMNHGRVITMQLSFALAVVVPLLVHLQFRSDVWASTLLFLLPVPGQLLVKSVTGGSYVISWLVVNSITTAMWVSESNEMRTVFEIMFTAFSLVTFGDINSVIRRVQQDSDIIVTNGCDSFLVLALIATLIGIPIQVGAPSCAATVFTISSAAACLVPCILIKTFHKSP